MPKVFETSARKRLQTFLERKGQPVKIEAITPDASTREYFRVTSAGATSIACVYPQPFDNDLPQIDVTNLFLKSDLPVARIFAIDNELGILIHEDFGDRILRDVMTNSAPDKREKLYEQAISLIAQIQKATPEAIRSNSIASRLRFDEEKLLWELNFFKIHYIESLNKSRLSKEQDIALTAEFTKLSKELEGFANVLTHRDFHAANLMLDNQGDVKIIDHQDARIGSGAYDLVSLLLDRITEIPAEEWLTEKKRYFLHERERLGFEPIKFREFAYEFDLVAIQRCLKAIGTFSNQAANFGKTEYMQYIDPMFEIALLAAERLNRFHFLQKTIEEAYEFERKATPERLG